MVLFFACKSLIQLTFVIKNVTQFHKLICHLHTAMECYICEFTKH